MNNSNNSNDSNSNRENHLSNTTCLTHVFFKNGERHCKAWWSLTRRKMHKTNEVVLEPPKVNNIYLMSMYIYIYIYTHTYIHTYIYREREGEISIYIYIHMCGERGRDYTHCIYVYYILLIIRRGATCAINPLYQSTPCYHMK